MPAKSRNSLDGKITTIRRGLAIYKVKASPFWQARIRDPRIHGYVVRSTKETSKIEARKAASELAVSMLAGVRPIEKEFTFRYYAIRMMTKGTGLVARGERNANYVRTTRLFLENTDWGLIKAFGSRDIRSLRTKDYQEFMDALSVSRPDLSTSTRNMLAASFRNVLKVARDDGVIESIPSTPRTRQKDNPRSFFPFHPLVAKKDDLYQQLLVSAKSLAKEGRVVRGIPITLELYDLILFTVHSFVRPISTELYALRHRDITVAEDEPRRLLLVIRNGKTGYRVSNTMEAAVSVYSRIKKRHPNAGPEDYLFFPEYENRATAARIVQRQFKVIMDESGVVDDVDRRIKYSLYSLRHTAICMRLVLSQGEVNIFNLAKNAGTSVDQIERFYAKNLPLTGEMALNLHKFGTTSKISPPKRKRKSKEDVAI